MIADHGDLYWSILLDSFVTECSRTDVVVSIVDELQGQTLVDSGVDALVVLGPEDDIVGRLSVPFGLPVMQTSGEAGGAGVLTYPIAEAAELLVSEFARCGRQRIAWLASTPKLNASLLFDELVRSTAGTRRTFTPVEVAQGADIGALLQDRGPFDAVTGAHANPRELLDSLERAGFECPHAFSIILMAEGLLESVTRPSITTLSWCAEESGRLLAHSAIAAAAGETSRPVAAPVALEARESTMHG